MLTLLSSKTPSPITIMPFPCSTSLFPPGSISTMTLSLYFMLYESTQHSLTIHHCHQLCYEFWSLCSHSYGEIVVSLQAMQGNCVAPGNTRPVVISLPNTPQYVASSCVYYYIPQLERLSKLYHTLPHLCFAW